MTKRLSRPRWESKKSKVNDWKWQIAFSYECGSNIVRPNKRSLCEFPLVINCVTVIGRRRPGRPSFNFYSVFLSVPIHNVISSNLYSAAVQNSLLLTGSHELRRARNATERLENTQRERQRKPRRTMRLYNCTHERQRSIGKCVQPMTLRLPRMKLFNFVEIDRVYRWMQCFRWITQSPRTFYRSANQQNSSEFRWRASIDYVRTQNKRIRFNSN